MSHNLPNRVLGDGENESAFLSMADFFSLLSLTFIFLAFAFGSPSAGNQSMESLLAVDAQQTDQNTPDPTASYVALLKQGDSVLVRIVPPLNAASIERLVTMPLADPRETAKWVSEQIGQGPQPTEVILRLPRDETRAEVHSLFVEIARNAGLRFLVRVAVL